MGLASILMPTSGHGGLGPWVYRPRRPRESALYRLVDTHLATMVEVHEE